MNKQFLLLIIILLVSIESCMAAFLGSFEGGDSVTFSVVCLEDGGKRDAGCSSAGIEIIDPILGLYSLNGGTETFAEVSDSSQPGLWRGNYSIPSSPVTGIWSIFINLTNSNSTPASTVLNFQVVNSNAGLNSIGANVVTSLSNQAVIQGDIKSENLTILGNITNAVSDIIARGNSAWITATGFSTHSAADVWTAGTRTLTSNDTPNILGNVTNGVSDIISHGDGSWTAADVSSLATSAELRSMNITILGNITNAVSDIIARGNSAWITATGFSTHSAADVWTAGTRTLTSNDTPDILEKLVIINQSILENMTATSFSTSVSSSDQAAIGDQCAIRVLGANLTSTFSYNSSTLFLENITYNYSSLGIMTEETYSYRNDSYLNKTVRTKK